LEAVELEEVIHQEHLVVTYLEQTVVTQSLHVLHQQVAVVELVQELVQRVDLVVVDNLVERVVEQVTHLQ
jgi:hypothetical protein